MQKLFEIRKTFNQSVFSLLLGLFLVNLLPLTANAYTGGTYATLPVSISGGGQLTMEPGERRVITTQFKNTGDLTWHNYGPGYISIYTYGPKYRRSALDSGKWMSASQLLPPKEKDIAPGSVATISFEIQAPLEAGVYDETFKLASEDRSWVLGGEFTLHINVAEKSVEVTAAPAVTETSAETEAGTSTVANSETSGYGAELTVTSASKIKILAGKSILFTAVFKNTGSQTWANFGLVTPDVQLASAGSDFKHPSWNGTRLAYSDGQFVKPGDVAVVDFSLTAPVTNGLHTARFQLEANGIDVPGGVVEIPVEVTGGSPEIANAPIKESLPPAIQMVDQPNIRVGVLIVDDEVENKVTITSHESDFVIKDINGNLLVELKKDQLVTAYFENLRYYFDAGRGLEQSSYGLRFEPAIQGAVMSIENFDRRLTRGAVYADNTFRGVLEYRHNDSKNREWVINELPIEFYLRGLAETSDAHPVEMNRAQVVVARTYAYFYMTREGKRANEFMDLNSTPSDQLYQGYGREARSPLITRAVMDTAGQIVTFNKEVAITPYYARSNGATKDWSAVWWGDQPHAKSVVVACDAGKTEWGHGVGMPQSGANCLAKDGMTFDQIVKYFFTGVEIYKKWN